MFPIPPPSDMEAMSDFNLLRNFKSNLVKEGEWFSRSDFNVSNKKNVYIDSDRTGLKSSDRHHWAARMACDSLTSPSPIRSWYQEKHRKTLENSKFFESSPKTALALRKYIASQFRPTAAAAVYKMFNAKSVYDPCGGWGDRMVAAMAHNVDYHCTDTNPLAIAGYASMQYMYPHTSMLSFEYALAEESKPSIGYDLVFTSPPYWKAEKYQGEQSSHLQYRKFDDWLKNFLFKMLNNAWSGLQKNGHMVINVSDIYANHTYNRVVQPVLDLMSAESPYVIGYRMAKRVGSKSCNSGIFCEPIIIIKKTY